MQNEKCGSSRFCVDRIGFCTLKASQLPTAPASSGLVSFAAKRNEEKKTAPQSPPRLRPLFGGPPLGAGSEAWAVAAHPRWMSRTPPSGRAPPRTLRPSRSPPPIRDLESPQHHPRPVRPVPPRSPSPWRDQQAWRKMTQHHGPESPRWSSGHYWDHRRFSLTNAFEHNVIHTFQ